MTDHIYLRMIQFIYLYPLFDSLWKQLLYRRFNISDITIFKKYDSLLQVKLLNSI